MVVTASMLRPPMAEKHLSFDSSHDHDNLVHWSTMNPMYSEPMDAPNPPFEHYALLYVDGTGAVRTKTSPSMLKHEHYLFSEQAKSVFAAYSHSRYASPPAFEVSRKRHRPSASLTPQEEPYSLGFDDLGSDGVSMIPLRIGDTEKVLAYYESAFRAFQQINCRQIAKAYIKIIEPRKQVKYPYNGGKAGPGEKADPEKTKPEWWPPGVIHREPDHLKKPERIRLLIHIFRNLRKTRGIDVQKLEDAGLDAVRQIKPAERMSILNEIYRVRRLEEAYEDNCVDASTQIYVCNRDAQRAEIEEASSDSCSGFAEPESTILPKVEMDMEPATKLMRMSVSQPDETTWSSSFASQHTSQDSFSSERSRPCFHTDFSSQVSTFGEESDAATPLEYGPLPTISSVVGGADVNPAIPHYHWSYPPSSFPSSGLFSPHEVAPPHDIPVPQLMVMPSTY